MADILQLLSTDGFIKANKVIIKMYGLHEAILVGLLCSKQNYWNTHWDTRTYGQFDGFWFCTAEEIEEETTLSPYLQRNAIKNLEDAEILTTCLRGVPAKKYFKVNVKKLAGIFMLTDTNEVDNNNSNNLNPSCENPLQQEVKEFDGNKIKDKKIKDKKDSIKISENKFSDEIEEIIDYFNKVTNQKLRSSSKSHRKLISARLREGFTVDDFKTIIDKKYAEWHGTEFEKFIRPSTLFVESHFDTYLNQVISTKKKTAQDEVKRFNPNLTSQVLSEKVY